MRGYSERSKSGFTLIELLVVISIIGMLSSVVMAGMQSAREKGRFAAGQRFAMHTRSALYDDALVYFDFDTATGEGNVPNSGTAIASPSASQPRMPSGVATFIADTDLKKNGKNMKVLKGGTNYPFMWNENSNNKIKNAIKYRTYTYSLWYKPDSSICDISGIPVCMLVGTDIGSNFTGISVVLDANNSSYIATVKGFIGGAYISSANDSVVADYKIDNGKWTHIAFSVSPTKQELYINGQLVDDNDASLTEYTGTLTYSAVAIGGVTNGDTSAGFYDDVAFYGRPLVASDIKSIYAQGLVEHTLATKD